MARRKHVEEHVNHEAWAIPYGDLITLLLAFFVVMYATSTLNEGKYRVLSDSIVAAFRGTPRAPTPIQLNMATHADQSNLRGLARMPLDQAPQNLLRQQKVHLPIPVDAQVARAVDQKAKAQQVLGDIAAQMEESLAELIASDDVRLRQTQRGLEVAIGSDLLFGSGQASLAKEANSALAQVAKILAPYQAPITIEGHTDDRPIATSRFPSNWELSAGRAGRVVRLFADSGIDPQRLTIRAYGEHRPEASNSTEEGRNRNRRVLIIVQAALESELLKAP
nr:flagellar motor protein MotD [Oceanococcus sp. HetDA_MAG_MS8]